MISKFRIDLIFYSFIILISLIPLYFLNPGKIEIYSIKMYDINSVLLWRGEGGCSYYDFDTVKEYKDFSKYSFNPEGYTPLTINSNPILSDNKIYISFRDRIVSVDIKDMKEIWSKKVSITPKTSLTVIGDYIFLPSEKSIIGMDKENGEIVFKFNFKRERVITPINYKDGVIYFGTQYFFWHGLQSSEPLHVIMNGFDLRNKKFIFRYKIINQRKISFPIIYKDRIVFATNHFVIALDSNTGKRKWIKISKSNYISELIPVKDGVGYYYENINTSSILHAIDIETGMDVLTLNFDFPIVGIPSIDEKNIYLISYNGSLLSIDRINGNIKWIKSNLKPIYNSLTIVRDTIYLVNENSICVLNKDNGDIIWQGKEKVDMPVYSLIPSDKILIVPNFFEIYIYRSE